MKKLFTFISTWLLITGINAQDISVAIDKTYIQNYINTLIDSRAIAYTDSGDIDISFVAHSLKDLTLNSANGTVSMRIEGRIQVIINWAPDVDESIDIVINNAPISYYINNEGETVLRISATPFVDQNTINSVSGNIYAYIVNTGILFSVTVLHEPVPNTTTTIDIPANIKYFSAVDPAILDPNLRLLQVTSDAIKINLVLKEGPRFVRVANEVNGKQNVGSIEHEENSIWQPYISPKVFELNTGTLHKFGTPQDLLDETNGKNKYKNWTLKQVSDTRTEFAPRRIEEGIPNYDPTYLAKFDPANRVQLANKLDGIPGGSLTVNGTPISNNYDQYEYNAPLIFKTVSSSAPSGGDYFLGWNDGNTNQTRNYVVNQDINLTANYKGHLRTGQPNNADAQNQRRMVSSSQSAGYRTMVYESMGEVWFTASTDNGVTWSKEVRLSGGTGTASNPSLSNTFRYKKTDGTFASGPDQTMAVWVEGGGIHLQTLWDFNWIGWNTYPAGTSAQNSENHRTLVNIIPNLWYTPRSGARPVINLSQMGNDLNVDVVYEGQGTGIHYSNFIIAGNGQSLSGDLNAATVMSDQIEISTMTYHFSSSFCIRNFKSLIPTVVF